MCIYCLCAYLLSLFIIGVDNQINQFYTLNGKFHLKFDIKQQNNKESYTRAYYCTSNSNNQNCSGDMIVSGSSEEAKLRFNSCITGELVIEAELYPGRINDSLYVQV